MDKRDLKYWLGFSLIPGIGPVRFGQLEAAFKTLEAAWQAGSSELKQAGLDENVVKSINKTRPKLDLDAEMHKLDDLNVHLITWHDKAYPARLKEIYNRPALLFIKGEIKIEDEWCVSIVGTRQPTIYGRQVAEEMALGGCRVLAADICIADTGIAGPGGATPDKPVGLFYIGLAHRLTAYSQKHLFRGEREENKERAARSALGWLKIYLLNLG